MALFSRKKNTETAEATKAASPVQPSVSTARDLSPILKHARITEKATMGQGIGVYVFDVDVRASKRDIMQAVKLLYGVNARKVSVVSIPKKNIRSARTGRTGVKGGGRKAYVYLKKGETITLA